MINVREMSDDVDDDVENQKATEENGEGLDEERAQAMAEQLVESQQSSSGDSSARKKRRAALLEWMLQNDRNEIDVGAGIAFVDFKPEPIKFNDLLAFTLKNDEQYGWSDAKIDTLIQIMADTKERIAETKAVLRIRLKKSNSRAKSGAKKRNAPSNDGSDDSDDGSERPITRRSSKSIDEKHSVGTGSTSQVPIFSFGDAVADANSPAVVFRNPWRENQNTNSNLNLEKSSLNKNELSEKAPKMDMIKKEAVSAKDENSLWKRPLPPQYERSMDVVDITEGRSRPAYQFIDALGPIRISNPNPNPPIQTAN